MIVEKFVEAEFASNFSKNNMNDQIEWQIILIKRYYNCTKSKLDYNLFAKNLPLNFFIWK